MAQLVWPFFFILGTLVGSFSNVLILRHGIKEAPRARSGCAACGEQLRWFELVPIISFMVLRGTCARCGSKLSWQYPLVELLLGTLFAAVFYFSLPLYTIYDYLLLITTFVFWTVFVVLTVYDLKHTLVPYVFSFSLIASALVFRALEAVMFQSMYPLYDALIGAFIFGGFLFFLYIITRGRGMGAGDGYVGVALGMLFGAQQSLDVLALSFWIGAGVGIVLLLLKKGFKMKTEVPFVPFLFVASIIGAFTSFSALALVSALIY